MIKSEQERIYRYLKRRYESHSKSRQALILDDILCRLKESSEWNMDLLRELVQTLVEEGKSMAAVLATLDLLDLEERT